MCRLGLRSLPGATVPEVSDTLRLRAASFRRDPERDGWPSVSVIVPVRNEGQHLERAIASILAQEYPGPFDVCLAVAPSDDDTAALAAGLAARDDRVAVVANPAGVTPAGLNAAIAATTGSIVVRVDGHAEVSDGYIRRAAETMCRTGAVNVGGMQVPKPQTPFETAVASATTSWLGTGGATYRVGGAEGPVDTVYLGVFDRTAGDAVGWFDETLIRNQDYELNIRLRKAGGQVWFDPLLNVGYRPRSSWTALAKQYYEYGWWKAAVVRRHPDSLRLRQVAPASLPIVLAFATLRAGRRPSSLIVPSAYAGIVAICSIGRSRPVWTAAITATMQTCWGVGFWRGFCDRRGSATGP